MSAVWAIWLLIVIGLPTLFLFVLIALVKRKASLGLIENVDPFSNVAVKVETLVGLGRLDERIGQDILESVINSLDELGWNAHDEAILEFRTSPFIVQAFENCGHKISED